MAYQTPDQVTYITPDQVTYLTPHQVTYQAPDLVASPADGLLTYDGAQTKHKPQPVITTGFPCGLDWIPDMT